LARVLWNIPTVTNRQGGKRTADLRAGRNEQEPATAGKRFGEEFGETFAGKAVVWGPAVAGAALSGPVAVLVGLVTSAAIVPSGGGNSPQSGGQQDPSVRDQLDLLIALAASS
jgi:hypothetical protein